MSQCGCIPSPLSDQEKQIRQNYPCILSSPYSIHHYLSAFFFYGGRVFVFSCTWCALQMQKYSLPFTFNFDNSTLIVIHIHSMLYSRPLSLIDTLNDDVLLNIFYLYQLNVPDNMMRTAFPTLIGMANVGSTSWRRFADGGCISYLHHHHS